MSQYIECVADVLLTNLNQPKFYNTPNPFEFMHTISSRTKTSFFERRVSEYKKYKPFSSNNETLELLDDF